MQLNKCSIKLSLVKSLEIVVLFVELLIKFILFKTGVLIYAEHCISLLCLVQINIWVDEDLLTQSGEHVEEHIHMVIN